MGYDLEFHFDSKEEYNREALINRFCQAGAELIDDSHYDEPAIRILDLTNIWFRKGETVSTVLILLHYSSIFLILLI